MRWLRAISDCLGDSRLDRPAVRGQLHPGRGLQLVEAAEVWPQGAASGPRQGRPGVAGSVEKGGLQQALAGAGVRQETAWGFADEMRVGLRGMVRRWCGTERRATDTNG